MLRSVLEVFFPRTCPCCRARTAAWMCDPCLEQVPWIRCACLRCAMPADRDVSSCARCRDRRFSFDAAAAAARYAGPARDALMAFKVGGERRASADLARAMAAVAHRLGEADTVTFVPATARSMAARGFNPAEELASHVARAVRLPCARLLRKTMETADQTDLSRSERARNVRDAFVAGPAPGARVLLVDDILTTGATADECARALRAAGAAQIAILTFAVAE